MTSRGRYGPRCHRWLLVVLAAAVSVLSSGPLGTSWAQQIPPKSSTPGPSGVETATPGQVVHSWALMPGGPDPDTPGNRSDLTYDTTAGATIEDTVVLVNYSNVALTFRLYATDALNNPDGDFDLLPGETKPKDVGSWVTLPQENITLLPGTQASMPMVIKVPAGATPGDHVGAVLASSSTVGSSPSKKVVVLDRRTGSRLYVRVAGPINPELVVTKLKSKYQPALNPLGGSAEVSYRVENRGNVRLGGTQQVSIAAPMGVAKKSKPVLKLPELLPGQGVNLKASFKGVMATGLAITKVKLNAKPVAKDVGAIPTRSSRSLSAAIPLTVLVALVAPWLLRRASSRYRENIAKRGPQVSTGVSDLP